MHIQPFLHKKEHWLTELVSLKLGPGGIMFYVLFVKKIFTSNSIIRLGVMKTVSNQERKVQPNLQVIQVTAELLMVSEGTIQQGEEPLHVRAAGRTELVFQRLQLDVAIHPRLEITWGIEVPVPRAKWNVSWNYSRRCTFGEFLSSNSNRRRIHAIALSKLSWYCIFIYRRRERVTGSRRARSRSGGRRTGEGRSRRAGATRRWGPPRGRRNREAPGSRRRRRWRWPAGLGPAPPWRVRSVEKIAPDSWERDAKWQRGPRAFFSFFNPKFLLSWGNECITSIQSDATSRGARVYIY